MERFVFPFRISPVDVVVKRKRNVSSRPRLTVVCCCRSCVSCLFGDGVGYLGFLRVGVIPVPNLSLSRVLQSLLRDGGESEGRCNRGESVLLDALCVCLWLRFDGSSMALKRSLDTPQLFWSFRLRHAVWSSPRVW